MAVSTHPGEHGPTRPAPSAGSSAPTESSPAAPHGEPREAELALPRYSTRGAAPGPRGCWALNRDGDPCGAAVRKDGDYCNAHSGIGVTSDPARYAALGRVASVEARRRRATLRATLGITRPNTPRGVLKALAFHHSEAIAAAALDGAISSEIPAQSRAAHALRLINEVDPPLQIEASVALPDNPEGVEALSYRDLLSIAEQHGYRGSEPSEMALPDITVTGP